MAFPKQDSADELQSEELSAAEEQILRSQCISYARCLVPVWTVSVVLIFASFLPSGGSLQHLRLPLSSIVVGGGAGMIGFKVAASSSDMHIIRNAMYAENFALAVRLALHAIANLCDGDDSYVFMKIFRIVMFPIGSSKTCNSPASLKVYLFLQNLLVLMHFAPDLQNQAQNWVWLGTSAFVTIFCIDTMKQHMVQLQLRVQLAAAYRASEQIIEVTTSDIFERLCDASVSLETDGHIIKAGSQLPSMLGLSTKSLATRSFSSLVHNDDLTEFEEFLDVANHDFGQVHYRQMGLSDAFGQRVPVHVLHTSCVRLDGSLTILMGISETWQPPKAKGSTRRRSHQHARATDRSSLLGSEAEDVCLDPATLALVTKEEVQPEPKATLPMAEVWKRTPGHYEDS